MSAATKNELDIDSRMTAHREEAKYLVSVEQARVLVAALDRWLEVHRHRGEGANKLPQPQHYVTTIYFDTPSRTLFREAMRSASHLKLRAKEYYDLHPDLTETATDLKQIVRFQPILWLEVKARDGLYSGKRRIGIPKRDVPAFFAHGEVTSEMMKIQAELHGAEAHGVIEAVRDLCRSCGEPLRADCLVNYRRKAWQDEAGGLRVTLDTGLAFFRAPSDLWERDTALLRSTLGPAVAQESRRVLEIKSRAERPAWLTDLLEAHRIALAPFSKFEAASSAVHG